MKKKGFTLIEVIISLIVITVGLIATIKTITDSTRNASSIQNYVLAHWVAMDIIASIQTHILPIPEDNTSTGTTTMLSKTWYWSVGLAPSHSPYTANIYVSVAPTENEKSIVHLTGFVPRE